MSTLKPSTFKEEGLTTVARGHVRYYHIITDAHVEDCVTVKGNIIYSKVGEPGARPWFIIECYNIHSVRFHLVTDGDEWYGYNPRSRMLNSKTRIAKSVDLDELTTVDQEIIKAAISSYIFTPTTVKAPLC